MNTKLFTEEINEYRETWIWAVPVLVLAIFLLGQLIVLLPADAFGLVTRETVETYPTVLYLVIGSFTMVALLWTLLRPAPIAGFGRFLAAAVASFGLGWALGIVRIATRSILGSILLASTWAAIGLASIAVEGRIELPGMNVESTHLPWSITIGSALLVGWAGWTIFREAELRFNADRATGPDDPS